MEYIFFDTLVIGSGAAGFSAACRLKENNVSTAIITEGRKLGTSRNTGSDKQTYYKLTLSGGTGDSVRKMAETLYSGGASDGDTALAEAALSVRCFMYLSELGVAFPHNRYGEYTGYKTDHDPFCRATSAGPYTSKFMTEALEKRAEELSVPLFDNMLSVRILKNEKGVCGLICLDTAKAELKAFACNNIILATGGPAGIYEDSVYPTSHTGYSSLALEAGAHFQNLTEWQFGLASINPRWNVSGTYMQVLPRLVSIDEKGKEREFSGDFFKDKYEALSMLFLKGYQWPFDCKKVMNGSSVIDLLVYKEKSLGRRVYLDFRKNPFGLEEIDFKLLSEEAYEYLRKADALCGTPIERLMKMNAPAVSLYADKGAYIDKDMLEISLCAQHNNGGISVDMWWQTAVEGLFAAGECAGTHGVVRPGGTALNAGQTGSLRAALYISRNKREKAGEEEFIKTAQKAITEEKDFISKALSNKGNAFSLLKKARQSMSLNAGAIRNRENMSRYLIEVNALLEEFGEKAGIPTENEALILYKLRDTLLMQKAVLTAMCEYSDYSGLSRGSALYTDKNGILREGLEEIFRHKKEEATEESIQEIYLEKGEIKILRRKRRAIPEEDDFFENVWKAYRENGNIY